MAAPTPLHTACLEGQSTTVSILLEHGAAVNGAMHGGVTPLYLACRHGHNTIASTLLAHGAEVNQGMDDNFTPLIVACQHGHGTTVSILLEHGAKVNHVTNDGVTPLLVTCLEGHSTIVSTLLAHGAAVNQTMGNGGSPLFIACCQGHTECAQLLSSSSKGANRTFADHDGNTAESVTAACGRHELNAWLILSRQWTTPLHHLTIIDTARARTLLRDGADISAAVDAAGPTPLSLANDMGTAGQAGDGSPANLVLKAAEPWSPRTHALFPHPARARAAELLLPLHAVAWEKMRGGGMDAVDFAHLVMQFAVLRM